MTDTKIIPIVPIGLVLFPRQELPLRILEPRHKQLVDDCIIGDGQFGVCLIDKRGSINGWDSPKLVGTIAKILKCKNVKHDILQIYIETLGRSSFKIRRIIPPSVAMPESYDALSIEGHLEISKMHEKIGTKEKMYIRAEVEMIPEIDENVSLERWETLVYLWKKKIIKQALPQIIDSHSLDNVLEQYYLDTDMPTVDYIYSLSAIGADDPDDLQPILEATTIDELIQRVEELLIIK